MSPLLSPAFVGNGESSVAYPIRPAYPGHTLPFSHGVWFVGARRAFTGAPLFFATMQPFLLHNLSRRGEQGVCVCINRRIRYNTV